MKKILLIFFLFNSFNCFSQSTAIDFYNEAIKKAYNKNYQGAILDYSKAIQIDSNKFSAYSGRAGAYMNNGNYHDAIRDFNKAIELNANSSFDYVNRGISRYVVNDFDGAIEDLSKTIELDPTISHAYIYLGVINLYWHEKYKEALSNYSKAINLNSDYRDSSIICGDLCYRLGDYAGAIDNYYNNIAYLSNEEKAKLYLKIGYCFEKLGNLKRASRFYKESIDLKPNLGTWDYYKDYDSDLFHINNISQYSNIHYFKSFKYVIYDVDFDLLMGVIVSIIILLFIFSYLCIIEGFFLSFRQKLKIIYVSYKIKLGSALLKIKSAIHLLMNKFLFQSAIYNFIIKYKINKIIFVSYVVLLFLQHSKFTNTVNAYQVPEKSEKGIPLVLYKDSIDVCYSFKFTSLLKNEIEILKEINNKDYKFHNDGINGVKLVPDFIDKEQVYFNAAWKDFRTIFLFGWLFEYDKIT